MNSPIDKVSPFADPPRKAKTNSYMAQAQPSDIGFGYIAQDDEHVEVPMTPASPLKSAMKMPGATSRWEANPLSPTFHEEQALEKKEELTEKEQAKDLVSKMLCAPCYISPSTNEPAESQDQSAGSEVHAPRRQLQLQSHRSLHALHNFDHLPHHQGPTSQEQSPSLGRWNQDMAAVGSPLYVKRIPPALLDRSLRLLERRPQAG